ncbi:adhesion G protein-coupled receptor E1-like [Anneissia japonica]|uniref:adhesion G protein-coupled receptor E1-like n=1 Tax=Anneissia japonica TaxID=1529436 RepID=UPI0014256FF0|nr:adhesion G protein-coupled receptor E1-like [Anneissia japonica]
MCIRDSLIFCEYNSEYGYSSIWTLPVPNIEDAESDPVHVFDVHTISDIDSNGSHIYAVSNGRVYDINLSTGMTIEMTYDFYIRSLLIVPGISEIPLGVSLISPMPTPEIASDEVNSIDPRLPDVAADVTTAHSRELPLVSSIFPRSPVSATDDLTVRVTATTRTRDPLSSELSSVAVSSTPEFPSEELSSIDPRLSDSAANGLPVTVTTTTRTRDSLSSELSSSTPEFPSEEVSFINPHSSDSAADVSSARVTTAIPTTDPHSSELSSIAVSSTPEFPPHEVSSIGPRSTDSATNASSAGVTRTIGTTDPTPSELSSIAVSSTPDFISDVVNNTDPRSPDSVTDARATAASTTDTPLSEFSSIPLSSTPELPSEEMSSIDQHSSPSSASDRMYLSADGNIAGETLTSWITSQETDVLHQLDSSSSDSYFSSDLKSVYSTASWIRNVTHIRKNIETETNQSVSATVKVPLNKGNLAIVIIYMESDIVATGLGNDVQLDDTTSEVLQRSTYLISGLLSISIYGTNDSIDTHVEFSLPIINKSLNYDEKPVCGFYDTVSSKWSIRGCEVLNVSDEIVHCFCSHLTSFAVLVQISNHQLPPYHEVLISRITIIGLSLSVVTLIINLLIYMVLRLDKKSKRHKIHINLIICMIGVDIIFLTAINKTENKLSCKIVSMLLHYLLLCMFMWMLAEAIYLVVKVIKNALNKYKLKHYILVCYTMPAFIVTLVAAIRYDCYMTENLCWLSRHCRLALVIPALAITGVNIIVLGKMIYVIYTRSGSMLRKPPKIQKEYKQLRAAVRGSFVLLPILGVTWILGPFAVRSDSLYIVYLFNILNSLQGVFVFVVCCLLDNEVKEAGRKWIVRNIRCKNMINHSARRQHNVSASMDFYGV